MASLLTIPDQKKRDDYEDSYYQRLETASKKVAQDKLMRLNWINMMIERIVSATKIIEKDSSTYLHPRVRETLKNYIVADVTNPDDENPIAQKKLFLKKDGSKKHWEAVPLSKTFPIVMKAHLLTNHGGIDAMSKWLSDSHLAVASICMSTILEVCEDCPNKASKDINYELLNIMQKHNKCGLIHIVDMSTHATDEQLDRLLVYQDMNTQFLQLRPISSKSLIESMSIELTHLFSDMSSPTCIIVSSELKDLFTQVLKTLNQIFTPEIQVITTESTSMSLLKSNDIATKAETAIKNWMSLAEGNNWCIGCFVVQWELNNVCGEDGKSPFEKVFGRKFVKSNQASATSQILESIEVLNINSSDEKIDDFISKNPVLVMPLE